MHPNRAFRATPKEQALEFARSRGFGILAVSAEEGPHLSHIPFIVNKEGTSVDLHLVRTNPIARIKSDSIPAKLVVSGPDSYISPDWYKMDDQVPTWNYVAVHLAGTMVAMPDGDLPDLLERLSDHFEAKLAPKPIWKQEKTDPQALAAMMRQIRPYRFQISDVQSTFKLNQNKPNDARLAAAQEVAQHGIGSEIRELAHLMQAPIEKG